MGSKDTVIKVSSLLIATVVVRKIDDGLTDHFNGVIIVFNGIGLRSRLESNSFSKILLRSEKIVLDRFRDLGGEGKILGIGLVDLGSDNSSSI